MRGDGSVKRAAGYIRESTVAQGDKYGPDAQRAAILRACTELGLAAPDTWYTDLVSGTGALKRSDFQRMVADARARAFDVLVVYDTSRWARNEADAFTYQATLAAAGVRIYYVMERAWSDEDDRAVVIGMNHVMNADYSRRLSRKIRDGYAAKFEQLGLPGGTAPWGYRFADGSRRLVATEDAKIRALALHLYATGEHSTRTLADELNGRGHRINGRAFTQWSIVEILRNPIAIGVTRRHAGRAGEATREGVVEPIVDREAWERCQRLRGTRRFTAGARSPGAFVLARVGVHEACGTRLRGERARTRRGLVRRLMHARATSCGVAFNRDEEPFEQTFADWLASWRIDGRQRSRIVSFVSEERPDTQDRRAAIERRLERARKLYLLGDLDDETYAAERAAAQREFDALPQPQRDAGPIIHAAEEIAQAWPLASLEARRAFVEELCERVVLGDGTMKLVIREKYRALVAAIAPQELVGKNPAPSHVGRGQWRRANAQTQERSMWARRDSNPHALSSNRS